MKHIFCAIAVVILLGTSCSKSLPKELPIRLAELRGTLVMERIIAAQPRPERVALIQTIQQEALADAEWAAASHVWGDAPGLTRIRISTGDDAYLQSIEAGLDAATIKKLMQSEVFSALCVMSKLSDSVAALSPGSLPPIHYGQPVNRDSVWANRSGKSVIQSVLLAVDQTDLATLDPDAVKSTAVYTVYP